MCQHLNQNKKIKMLEQSKLKTKVIKSNKERPVYNYCLENTDNTQLFINSAAEYIKLLQFNPS